MKISFLIPAHNEEKIIAKTLENLTNFPYENYEIILGLDGCTDKTEEIVKDFMKKSKKIKYYKLNLRNGKPAVINTIIKASEGEIIIINDADWIFNFGDEEKIKKFLSVFDNPKIGGIAESFPVEWEEKKLKKANLGYKTVAYGTFFWMQYQKKSMTSKKGDLLYIKEPTMFLTNIFRRSLYRQNFSLGDDFERTKSIMDKGYEIVLFKECEAPRMTAVYNRIMLGDLVKQKIRTAIARRQLTQSKIMSVNLRYYFSSVFFILSQSWKRGIFVGILSTFWVLITAIGEFISKFKESDTKKSWQLRAAR